MFQRMRFYYGDEEVKVYEIHTRFDSNIQKKIFLGGRRGEEFENGNGLLN